MGKSALAPLFQRGELCPCNSISLVLDLHIPLEKGGSRGIFLCDKNHAPLLDPQLSQDFAQKRHVMRDTNRHITLLGLLLNETPLDTQIVVGEHAVLADARFGEI
jgi:hypothetical protein